ncbi:MAG: nuclear transport factor 2 family protein [Parcubacteria group bacterium]
MMTIDKLTALARQWIDAMNGHDIEAVLALYADDADHTSPATDFISGKGSLREWWSGCFDRLPSLRYVVLSITAQEPNRVILEYQRLADSQPAWAVAEVFEVDTSGLITHSRVYHGC